MGHEPTASRHLHDACHHGRRGNLYGQGGEGVMRGIANPLFEASGLQIRRSQVGTGERG